MSHEEAVGRSFLDHLLPFFSLSLGVSLEVIPLGSCRKGCREAYLDTVAAAAAVAAAAVAIVSLTYGRMYVHRYDGL